jgi:hypothetical protein
MGSGPDIHIRTLFWAIEHGIVFAAFHIASNFMCIAASNKRWLEVFIVELPQILDCGTRVGN